MAFKTMDLAQRIENLTERDAAGCWRWRARLDDEGYGVIQMNKGGSRCTKKLAHRISYELFVGPIPDGLEIDHLCRVRDCVNPAHLEAVTHDENMRRVVAARTHCKHGHEYTPENTYVSANGDASRHCRACWRRTSREYKLRKAATRSQDR